MSSCSQPVDNSVRSSLTINGTTCEYLENPLGIDVVKPRLSWEMNSPQFNKSQSAYEILVASSIEKLNNNQGDLWDTGKELSGQSVHVTYAGSSLKSRQKCYWKVRVWDESDKISEWSEVNSWEMAFLNESEWEASWIEAPRVYNWTKLRLYTRSLEKADTKLDYEPAPYLRRTFSVNGKIKQARAYVSGLGYYEMYLNGKKMRDHVLDPSFTDYDKRVQYVTYDVTRDLLEGKNALGVLLGDGWYNMHSRAVWSFDRAPWKDRPTCLVQLEIEYEDGTIDKILSNESWKAAPSPTTYNDIRQGEKYDARLEIPEWNTADFDDKEWIGVREKSGPKGQLVAQMIPANKVMRELKPVSIKSPKPGTYLVDMGQNTAGWIQLKVKGESGDVVQMKFGEILNADGTLDQSNINRHHREPEFQVASYTLKGGMVETWEPKFTYYGFQYVEISGYPGELSKDDIIGKVVHTSFEEAGSFVCSNEILNRIHHASEWSYISNFLGYPTDCPQREKNGWTGDAHLSAETGLLTFNAEAAYTKWLNDCKDAQLKSGKLPGIVPTSGWGYDFGDRMPHGYGPAWDGAYIWVPWYMYLYSGDVKVFMDHYENMKKCVDFMTEKANDHILDIGLGDWVFINTYAPRDLTSTACYYDLTSKFAQIAEILGNEKDATNYAQLAANIKSAFNQKYYKSNDKTYTNGEQTALAAALYFHLVPENDIERVAATLTDVIKQNNSLLDCGVLGAKWIPQALADNGYAQLAFDIARDTRYPGWGFWMENGATTLWEDFDVKSNDNSHNHMFFGDIVHWSYQVLAGIQPVQDDPGFKHFRIVPFFVRPLDMVKANHESMYGNIVSLWQRGESGVHMEIEIPVNTTSTVVLPVNSKSLVKINNQDLEASHWQNRSKIIGENLEIDFGSGNYSISFREAMF